MFFKRKSLTKDLNKNSNIISEVKKELINKCRSIAIDVLIGMPFELLEEKTP